MTRGKRLVVKPGTRFGRVTVLHEVAQRRNHERYFLCECDCGTVWEVALGTLTGGETKSCGCLRRERFVSRLESHGQSRMPLYSVWRAMRQRCQNAANPVYEHYGGRGIRVCDEWQGFAAFSDWAMTNGYRAGLTIERIDNDGNYEPSNCTWIPQSQQSNNTRRNRILTFRGKTMNLAEWADRLGINPATLGGRISRGWGIEATLTIPVRSTRRWPQR